MSELSVFTFDDHKEYLRNLYASKKASRQQITLSAFSIQLGFGTGNYFGLVVDGKRNLSLENIHKICSNLHFTFDEAEYFENLVHLNQTSSEEGRRRYRLRLSRIKKLQPAQVVKFSSKHLVGQWQALAILVGLDRVPVADALKKMTTLFPFEKTFIEATLQQFLREGILTEHEGLYHMNGSHQIFHDIHSSSRRHKEFLSAQLALSKNMLDKNYEKGARFYSHTFSIAKKDFEFYEERVRTLLSEFAHRSDQTAPDEVAQLSVQLFRMNTGTL